MEQRLDSTIQAELENDRGEMPQEILDRARKELIGRAQESLSPDTIYEALADESLLELIVENTVKLNGRSSARIGVMVIKTVFDYIDPSPEEVKQLAEVNLAESDYQNGRRA